MSQAEEHHPIRYVPPGEKFRAWKESRQNPSWIRAVIYGLLINLFVLSIPFIALALFMVWVFWSMSQPGGWIQ
jgi:hypothetical protein